MAYTRRRSAWSKRAAPASRARARKPARRARSNGAQTVRVVIETAPESGVRRTPLSVSRPGGRRSRL